MLRTASRVGLLALMGTLGWVAVTLAANVAQNAPPAASPPRMTAELRHKIAVDLRERLETPITVEFDAAPLKDALTHLTERYNIPILVETEAFKEAVQVPDVENNQVKLAKLVGVSVRTVLRQLVAQVQGEYVIRDGLVVVIPAVHKQPDNLFRQPVTGRFQRQSLADSLQELADLSGVSIVLDDTRTADHAKALVTARLDDVPVQTAVKVLADMAGLKAVALENLLYVTTEENAARLQAERDGCPAVPKGEAAKPKPPPAKTGM